MPTSIPTCSPINLVYIFRPFYLRHIVTEFSRLSAFKYSLRSMFIYMEMG